jgi:transposase
MYYENNELVPYNEPHKINITWGYSRDAHPELVQIMEQMMIDNVTGIPLFMEPENGNSNDSKAFQRMIKIFDSFKEYTDDGYVYLCGDSALYSSDNVKMMQESGIKYVTRAADGKLKIVQKFIAEHSDDKLSAIDEVNTGKIYIVEDCEVKQKWLLVHSSAAESRNEHSVERSAENELKKQNKKIAEYQKTYYSCTPDAQKEIEKFKKKCNSYCKVVKADIIEEEIPKRGRKSKVAKPDEKKEYRYRLDIQVTIDEDYCRMVKRNKSFFVIATNDVEREWEPAELLKQYKSQSRVERGFRFLKDPEFFADSIFLSKNERIQSLLTVMTLSLAVFSGLEWKLQNKMKETGTKLKNQVGKPVDKVTLRYVFQKFEEFMINIYEDGYRLFDILNDQQNKILELLGRNYQKAYGV